MRGQYLLILASCCFAWQDTNSLSPRQLFYTERPARAAQAPAEAKTNRTEKRSKALPSKPVPQAAPSYPGLRYSLLKIGARGQATEVDPDTVFRAGDRIKVRVTPNIDGFLYIVHQGSSQSWEVLFPAASIRQGNNAVTKFAPVTVPEGEEFDLEFDEKPGEEKLFIVLSTEPEPNLDNLIYSLGGSRSSAQGRVLMASSSVSIPESGMAPFRSGLVSRDLRIQRRPAVQSGTTRHEEAVYVVNASSSKDNTRVVAEVTLKHR